MGFPVGFRERLRRSFSIDLRTLALFRVGLGILLIADLLLRARHLTAHYTDFGVFPRLAAINYLSDWRLSVHLINGTTDFQAALFVLAGISAFLLMIGWRTRLMTLLSWLLLLSLNNRNPLLLQGGDNLLLLMLFWSNFLPLGARFSVDAAMDPEPRKRVSQYFSIATFALLIQFMSVYFFSAFLKSGPEWMPIGNATFIALNTDVMVTSIGAWAANFPALLQVLTYFVWLLELIGPVLIFSPILFLPIRLTLQVMFIMMHVGFLLCLNIGMFPFISILSLLTFTPSKVWDYVGAKVRTRERIGLQIFYDGECDFCRKVCLLMREFLLLPDTPVRTAQEHPKIYAEMQHHNSWVVRDSEGRLYVRWQAFKYLLRQSILFWPAAFLMGTGKPGRSVGDWVYDLVARRRRKLSLITKTCLPYRRQSVPGSMLANGAAAVFILMILAHNFDGLDGERSEYLSGPFRAVFVTLRLDQKWNMFAPKPLRASKWVMAEAKSIAGDKFSFAPMASAPHQDTYTGRTYYKYPVYRWRKYLNRISDKRHKSRRRYLAAFLCNELNNTRRKSDKVKTLKLSADAIVTDLDWISAQDYQVEKRYRSNLLLEFDCQKKRVR